MRPLLEKPFGRIDEVADRAGQVLPTPLRRPLFDVLLRQRFVIGEKERQLEDTGRFVARQPIDKHRPALLNTRQEAVARIVALASSKQRVGAYVTTASADSSNRASLDLADLRSTERKAEPVVRQEDLCCTPRAIKAAVRNLGFNRQSDRICLRRR